MALTEVFFYQLTSLIIQRHFLHTIRYYSTLNVSGLSLDFTYLQGV